MMKTVALNPKELRQAQTLPYLRCIHTATKMEDRCAP